MWAWGFQGSGLLGLNEATVKSSPTQIGTLATWSKIAINSHSMAISREIT